MSPPPTTTDRTSATLTPGGPPVATAIAPPPALSVGSTEIDGPFDPFASLLRDTTAVSGGKRTAFVTRKPPRDVAGARIPAWTTATGRRDLAKPSWWRPAEDHTYLVVPFVLPGSQPTHGYALYTVADGEARLVHGIELSRRTLNCGGESEVWALFGNRDGTAIYEVEGCTGTDVPTGPDACVVEVRDGELRRSCTGDLQHAWVGPR